MDILDTLKSRRSYRAYKPELISKDELTKITEAGEFAASAKGLQSAIIVAVSDKETRDQLSRMNAAVMGREGFDPFYGAPQVLVVLSDKNNPNRVYDGSLVMGNMMNEAASLGVASCWIHRAREMFDTDEGKALLAKWGITGEWEGIGNLIVGYPEGDAPVAKARKEHYVYFV